ncbi:MAG: hypothetical protein WEH44_11040 [Pirellulaceae bacterium]
MVIDVPCSGCGQKLQVGTEHAGKMARCPACGHITPVPAANGEPTSSAAAADPFPVEKPANWYMRTPEGQEFGPASRTDLDRWVTEGRVTADCQLRGGETEPWESADRVYPALTPPAPVPVWTPPTPVASSAYPLAPGSAPAATPYAGGFDPANSPGLMPRQAYQAQHRGGLILLLGLLGIILQPCPGPILAIAAWVMGSNDLREMEAGRMDRSGSDLTRAGMIMGLIISVLWMFGFVGVGGMIFLAALAG